MSHDLFEQAKRYIPGGVNSPVRAFKSVGGDPVFVNKAKGAHLWDETGKRYIDYVGSWGPMILGHADADVVEAVKKTADNGLSFGAPTVLETQLAKRVCELIPSIDRVRMVNSGTEATMSAIRLARGFTGRDRIVKFEGCYHGHADGLLVKAGSGALTLGVPTSPGVPAAMAEHTITLEFNNLDQVREVFGQLGETIAAIIVEPVAGNMNCIPPIAGFLQGLREVCNTYGSLLIFDEVMTGFRVGLQGAQGLYEVSPDLTTLGKVIGGGMPVGAFGGRADVMEHLAPLGPVYQAGTLSGNPVAMAAGLATLQKISHPDFYASLTEKTQHLTAGIQQAAQKASVSLTTSCVGGMFGVFFTESNPVTRFSEVMACDTDKFNHFFHAMLTSGVYLAPSAYEAGFVSIAHSEEDIGKTIASVEKSLCSSG